MGTIRASGFDNQIQNRIVPLGKQCPLVNGFPDIQADRSVMPRVVFLGQQLPKPADKPGLTIGHFKHLLNHFRMNRLTGFPLILIKQTDHLICCKIGHMQTSLDVERRALQTFYSQHGLYTDQGQAVKPVVFPGLIDIAEQCDNLVNDDRWQAVKFIDKQDDRFFKQAFFSVKQGSPFMDAFQHIDFFVKCIQHQKWNLL